MHIKSLEYFRAIAIIFIVAGHCVGVSGWRIDSFSERLLANLIGGGSALFVFISGFLFHHVFYPKFIYKKFLQKKFLYVYLPYLLLATIPIIYAVITKTVYPEFFFNDEHSLYERYVKPTILYYFYGGVLVYWYIPFIMTMFLLSPLFIKFIKIKTSIQTSITVIMFVMACFIQRPLNNISIIQSVLFFMPMYLFGIICSLNKETIYNFFSDKISYLFIATITLAATQSLIFETCGNLQTQFTNFNGIDINYIQKIFMSLFFLVYLHKFEKTNIKVLHDLATTSFAIYFIHGWIIEALHQLDTENIPFFGFHMFPILVMLTAYISYKTAMWIKKTIPNHSRYIIGV